MALKSSQEELQLWFRPRSNKRSEPGDMSFQSPGTPTQDNFRTPPWESQEKEPLRAAENTIWGKVVASLESRPW